LLKACDITIDELKDIVNSDNKKDTLLMKQATKLEQTKVIQQKSKSYTKRENPAIKTLSWNIFKIFK